MRFIPTFDLTVEQLRGKAKKLQRKGGGKHAELLDRVARGAGYSHWHHVIECNKQSSRKVGAQALLAECQAIVAAELEGDVRLVMTGPEVARSRHPFVLFSTGIGDAWLLSPENSTGLRLVWRGEPQPLAITEDAGGLVITWDVLYELTGAFMRLRPLDGGAELTVGGYPMPPLRDLIHRAQSVDLKLQTIFGQEGTVELTDAVIADLVRQGWDEAPLREAAAEGHRYSPSRGSVLSPVVSSFD